jgi:hypothetical protein
MGFSHSFVATRGVPKAQLLDQLGLAETEDAGDGDVVLSGFGLGKLAGGWLLVACNDFDLPAKAPLAAISAAGEVVCGALEEHVMVSEAAAFAGGAETWRVAHDPERGLEDLRISGRPPAALEALRETALTELRSKDDADYVFDVPTQLAASVCGFEFGRSEGEFIVLEQVRRLKKAKRPATERRGLFARLFGRG